MASVFFIHALETYFLRAVNFLPAKRRYGRIFGPALVAGFLLARTPPFKPLGNQTALCGQPLLRLPLPRQLLGLGYLGRGHLLGNDKAVLDRSIAIYSGR